MAETNEKPDPMPNICAFLGAHGAGNTAQELSRLLGEVVAALEEAALDGAKKCKGALTIKIVMERDDGVYRVGVDPSIKVPTARSVREVMWATERHGLVRENPRQQKFEFAQLDGKRTHIPT